ncbi:MAG: class II poly(R)-hydroxyalkanoic acid synthase, partial [Pseudomonadota bacterium]
MPDKQKSVAEDVAAEASEQTLALNPIVGLRGADLAKAATKVMTSMATNPGKMTNAWLGFTGEMINVVAGRADREADKRDRRFADPAWQKNPLAHGLMQTYLAWQETVEKTVESLELEGKDAARARLMSSIFTDAMAPSNNPMTNPTALKTLIDTGGQSAIA